MAILPASESKILPHHCPKAISAFEYNNFTLKSWTGKGKGKDEGIFFGDWEDYQELRSDEKMGEEEELWTMYDVIMIDKDELETVIDTSVIAKNADHARGKAGVFDKLKEKDFDDTKFVVKVAKIADIRPVKEDE